VILTSAEIDTQKIVSNPQTAGKRPTTYDATVGEIISNGARIDKPRYRLPPRGVVWVVSNEEFDLPADVTGLATLKTRWTHGGVLALNVGVIDPSRKGPLATAVVNFGNKGFDIKKNDPFFRVLFHRHLPTAGPAKISDRMQYIDEILEKSKNTSNTFLNISALAGEVTSEIFKSQLWVRVTLYLTVLALGVAIVAMLIPMAYGVSTDVLSSKIEITKMQSELERDHLRMEHTQN